MKGHADTFREWPDALPSTLSREIFDVLCGPLLGEGVYRRVFRCAIDPNFVVKFETRSSSFANVLEWEAWSVARYQEAGVWLAPCLAISDKGQVLIQRFAEDVTEAEIPDLVPAWLTDLKPENFGRVDGRIVCRDYGAAALLLRRGFDGRRMQTFEKVGKGGGFNMAQIDDDLVRRVVDRQQREAKK